MTRPNPALALAPLKPPSKGTLDSRTLRTPPSTPHGAGAEDTRTTHAGRWVTGEMLMHLSRQGDPPGWGGGSECRAGVRAAAGLQQPGGGRQAAGARPQQQGGGCGATAASLPRLGCSRQAVGAARARSLSSPPVEGEGGTRRRGPARLRIPGITWEDAGEMRSRLGEIESPA